MSRLRTVKRPVQETCSPNTVLHVGTVDPRPPNLLMGTLEGRLQIYLFHDSPNNPFFCSVLAGDVPGLFLVPAGDAAPLSEQRWSWRSCKL